MVLKGSHFWGGPLKIKRTPRRKLKGRPKRGGGAGVGRALTGFHHSGIGVELNPANSELTAGDPERVFHFLGGCLVASDVFFFRKHRTSPFSWDGLKGNPKEIQIETLFSKC